MGDASVGTFANQPSRVTENSEVAVYRCNPRFPLITFDLMFRWRALLFVVLFLVPLLGCSPQQEGQSEEQNDQFFQLGNRSRLRQHLLFEGERLQEDIQRLVAEFKPVLDAESAGPKK